MGPCPFLFAMRTHLNLIKYLCRRYGGGMEIKMSVISAKDNRIVIKGPTYFVVFSIVGAYMSYEGLSMIFSMLPFQGDYGALDYFGLAFLCVWTAIVISFTLFGFISFTKRIIIDQEGIHYSTVMKKELIKWSQIQDFGVSFSGCVGPGKAVCMYDLYFSKEVLKVKKNGKKVLKGKLIKIYLFDDYLSELSDTVFPYCKKFTSVEAYWNR